MALDELINTSAGERRPRLLLWPNGNRVIMVRVFGGWTFDKNSMQLLDHGIEEIGPPLGS